jgi:hypothetical protein
VYRQGGGRTEVIFKFHEDLITLRAISLSAFLARQSDTSIMHATPNPVTRKISIFPVPFFISLFEYFFVFQQV